MKPCVTSTTAVDRVALSELFELRRTLTGLEFHRGMMTGAVPATPMMAMLGVKLVEVDRGRIVCAATAGETFYSGMGVAHGGFAAALLDSALGSAVSTAMPAGRLFATLSLNVTYLRPLRREVGEVRCEARVVHMGQRIATADADIVGADGKIYAQATTTCVLAEPTARIDDTARLAQSGRAHSTRSATTGLTRVARRAGK